jgi:hypothetical protein
MVIDRNMRQWAPFTHEFMLHRRVDMSCRALDLSSNRQIELDQWEAERRGEEQ